MRIQIKNWRNQHINAFVDVEPFGTTGLLALQPAISGLSHDCHYVVHLPTTCRLTELLPFRSDAEEIILKVEAWAMKSDVHMIVLQINSQRRLRQHYLFDEFRGICKRGCERK